MSASGAVIPIVPEDPMPLAPLAPDDSACCGNGCDPCVWDFFQAEQAQYREALAAWQRRQAAREAASAGMPEGGGTGA